MIKNVPNKLGFLGAIFVAAVGFPLSFASNVFAQLPAPGVPEAPGAPPPATEVERVVVTGSNTPTAEETGANPLDTYRPQNIERPGIRNATDLQEFIPQEAGGTVNLNMGNGGEIRARKVSAWTTLDVILNYTFNLPPPAPAEVPGYAKDGGKNVKMKDGKEKNVVPVSTAE
jgi:hypothetical protein